VPVTFAEPSPVAWYDEPEPEVSARPRVVLVEPEPAPVASRSEADLLDAELDAALDGDVNSVVDALHRKARVEPVDVDVAAERSDRAAPLRSLRLIGPPSNYRRRRNTDDSQSS